MSKPLSSYYDATKYLGQYVSEKVPFLQNTSCMAPEIRELIAMLDTYIEFFCQDQAFKLFLRKKARPTLEKLGYALWRRDTVTDLALRKGPGVEEESFANPNTTQDAVPSP